jgi:hypothetical protein
MIFYNSFFKGTVMEESFFQTLKTQRWDDHRYYHHSRINQSLHFISALSFLVSYVYLFIDPVVSALIAWMISMTTRQAGHFFFEPKDYDVVNQATNDHKEFIKVGYNLRRKVVLMAIWAAIPAIAYFYPGYLTWFVPETDTSFIRLVGISWFALGVGGLLFRAVQLTIQDNIQVALSWVFKILTDPFHDLMLYYKSPIYLLKGQLIDPMEHVEQHGEHAHLA